MNRTVVILAKAPVPGRVKTRLCPPFLATEAAEIATASLRDTMDAVTRARCDRRLLLLEGPRMSWVPPTFDVVPQPMGGLDVRLAAAFTRADRPTVVIGMDTPQVSGSHLDAAFDALEGSADAVLGPAHDGGYWLLGLARPRPDVVLGIPMSTPSTGRAQQDRLDHLAMHTVLVPMLRDVDTAADVRAVASIVPASHFADALRRIAASRAGRAHRA